MYSVLLLSVLCVVAHGLTASSYLTQADQDRFKSIFLSAKPYSSDLKATFYSVLGLSLLGPGLDDTQKTCENVKANVDAKSIESIYYAASIASAIKEAKQTCQLTVTGAQQVIDETLKEGATSASIYYAVAAAKALGLKVDAAKVSPLLTAALKADETPSSYGFVFKTASLLGGDVSKFFEQIEDVVQLADEVEDKYLQFEGGLFPTALVINGAYKLASTVKKAPSIPEERVIKFVNYFLSRKHVQSVQNACALFAVLKTFATNEFHSPIAVSLASQVAVSDKAPVVKVKVSNLFGKSLGQVTVTADQARHIGDDAVVLSKKQLTASSEESVYEIDFMKLKPAPGFYKITVSVAPQKPDSRLLGISGAEVEVKVTTVISVENVELGVADREQVVAAKVIKLQHPAKATNEIEVDNHQRLTLKFQLRDKTSGSLITVHQTFVRMVHHKSQQEVIFVAEPDSTNTYKLDLDIGAKAKEFASQSGKYSFDLIVGDPVAQNPIQWSMADVKLSFSEGASPAGDSASLYAKKKDIEHMFREPEKRPPSTVSTLFTALCLAPLLVLFILWIKIGANVSNLPASLSALGFHVCLAAIFVLYFFYWTHLNMFDTLKYLSVLAVPTFLFGNSLLSGIAARRK